jgi:hypothetical protein
MYKYDSLEKMEEVLNSEEKKEIQEIIEKKYKKRFIPAKSVSRVLERRNENSLLAPLEIFYDAPTKMNNFFSKDMNSNDSITIIEGPDITRIPHKQVVHDM